MDFLKPYSEHAVKRRVVYTTKKSTSEKYTWTEFRRRKPLRPEFTYVFTDGSSTGWHSAVIVEPGAYVERLSRHLPRTQTRNVGAELNGVILGLGAVIPGKPVIVVSDYLGIAAWMQRHWFTKHIECMERVNAIREIIKDKGLEVEWWHHPGHQDKKGCTSDFTRYNCEADRLAKANREQYVGVRTWEEELR